MQRNTAMLTAWLPWLLAVVVIATSFLGWAEARHWKLDNLTALAIFPLLGLLAWSIMWTHYAYGALRLTSQSLKKNHLYSRISMYVVLGLLLLHPGLLAYSQWNLLGTLPPGSFYSWVAPSLKVYVLLGSLSLLLFLAYDVLYRFKDHGWTKRNWRWVSLSQMIAMVSIFIHALMLGGNLHSGWMQLFWIVLGALLIPCFGIILREEWAQNKSRSV